MDFSLVLPCFNEEKNIKYLYEEFLQIPLTNYKSELILVNNGSTDNTGLEIDEVIKINNLKKNNILVKKITLEKNEGYGGGISAGLKSTTGKYIGWSHADLQTPLIDFFRLFQLIKDKKNIYGKGFRVNNRGYDGIVSRFHERFASVILGHQMKEINAQPKIFSRNILEYFKEIPKNWTVLDTYSVYVCLVNKVEIVDVDVVFKTRIHGHSKWKNNLGTFIKHIFFNFLYLFKLRFSKVKK
tara:strand:+ start:5146 stop:5868 length:723 start_codon:yes stop_codon:yes gene_type:complete